MQPPFMRLYKSGVWAGNPDRTIRVGGVIHNLDEYAQQQGIQLPDKVNTNEDMEQTFSAGDSTDTGTGNSKDAE